MRSGNCTRRSSVPAAAKPLFRAATADLNPWTEAKVDTGNPERGTLLVVSGELHFREALRAARRLSASGSLVTVPAATTARPRPHR
jgi:hypothetical protein